MKILSYGGFVAEKLFRHEAFGFYDPVKNAVWNYVAGYTVTELNRALRQNRKSKELDEMCALMDSAMEKSPKGVLYRVVEWDYLRNIYDIYKDNLDDMLFGKFTAKAYTSATKKRKNIWGSFCDAEAFIEIDCRKPVNGIDVNEMFNPSEIDCADQEEIILQRNLDFTITGYAMTDRKGNPDENGDIYILYVKIL